MWVWQPLKPTSGTVFTQAFSETLSPSETLTLLRKKVFAETTSLSEAMSRKVRTFFSATTSLTEALVKKVKVAFSETDAKSETLGTVVMPGGGGGGPLHTMAQWGSQMCDKMLGRRR